MKLHTIAAVAAVAIGFATIVGCTQQVPGTPHANQQQATSYKLQASSSKAAVSSSKAAAAQKTAKFTECADFGPDTAPVVDSYNAFIAAANANAPDAIQKKNDAAAQLRDTARTIEQHTTSDTFPADFAAQLDDYVSAARALADETDRVGPGKSVDALNRASDTFESARKAVLDSCRVA